MNRIYAVISFEITAFACVERKGKKLTDRDYELIDCGAGRRLERFGGVICDRPAPMVSIAKKIPEEIWNAADVYYDGEKKCWRGNVPDDWSITVEKIVFKLELAAGGQVGIFPEQQSNWNWIQQKISSAGRKLKVLNCFAHTGGSSIAAALAGAEVCHLDAAKGANTRARINAELSGCSDSAIRWITEDALKFMQREVKRGNKYDVIILDPPAFGRMKKIIWKFEKDMPVLLSLAAELLSSSPSFLLLTSHNTGWIESDQVAFVKKNAAELLCGNCDFGGMSIPGTGNSLKLGVYLRVDYA